MKERGGRGATLKKRKWSTEDWGRKADNGEDMRKKKQRRKAKKTSAQSGSGLC